MEIFGLTPVQLTLIICVIGIALRVYIGYIKNPKSKFNVNVVVVSFFIGIIISVGLVAPTVESIDSGDELKAFAVIAGQIIVVMQSESIAKAGQKIMNNKKVESTI